MGQIEPLLFDHPGKPRYLLEGYHKIIDRIVDYQHVLYLPFLMFGKILAV
jgi:hypothetical protein